MPHPRYEKLSDILSELPVLAEVLDAYDLPGEPVKLERYGGGHINETLRLTLALPDGGCRRFMLQGLSRTAFPHPEEVMENFAGITSFLRQKIREQGGDPARETLSLYPARGGRPYCTDGSGRVWRLIPFVEGSFCALDATPELFEAAARAFGRFQYLLRDYPAQTLHETIKDFHNTEARYVRFEQALKADILGRAAQIPEEIAFIKARRADCSVAVDALRKGLLPLRVTHNDTKLDNVLFDGKTGEGLCVIDLDTTMPGLSVYDFGDAVRFGANHNREDEPDLSKVVFDLSLFECYTRGYLEGVRGSLTPAELDYLPWGARIITLECGIRFLTDYLEGDRYFRITYPEQNLRRARTQFKLVRDMEDAFGAMRAIVEKYRR